MTMIDTFINILIISQNLRCKLKKMSNNSQLNLFQNFIEKEELRTKVPISGETEAILDYCEYTIHSEYDKKSKTRYAFKQRKNQISDDFMRAYQTLDKEDKIRYYIKNVSYLLRIHNGNLKAPQIRTDILEALVYTKTHSLRRWRRKRMRLDNSRQVIFSERKEIIQQFDLGDYIFRGSKNTKYFTFVLEAIKSTVHKKLKTAHFGFQSAEDMQSWAQAVQLCIDFRHWQRIYIQLYHKLPPRQHLPNFKSQKQVLNEQKYPTRNSHQLQLLSLQREYPIGKTNFVKQKANKQMGKQSSSDEQFSSDSMSQTMSPTTPRKRANLQKSIIEQLVEGESNHNIQTLQYKNVKQFQNKNIKHFNFFHKMFPDFQFNQVEWQGNYEMIYNQTNMRIMQNMDDRQKYKMVLEFPSQKQTPCQYIFKAICGPNFEMEYNDNIQQTSIKTLISSENAAIMYMELKAFSRIYRPRDFVFIRHGFSIGSNAYYIADKGIENSNFPPFITIVRGKYQCVWAILRKSMNKILLIGTISMDNFGYLNDNQNSNLVLNYFKNFSKLPDYIRNNKDRLRQYVLFDINWDITKNKENQIQNQLRVKRKTQQIKLKQKQQMMYARQKSKFQTPTFQKYNKMELQTSPPNNQNIFIENKPNIRESVVKSEKSPQQRQNLDISFQRSSKKKQIEEERRKMSMEEGQGEVDLKQLQKTQLQTNAAVKLRFDEKGMVIIQKGFIRNRYQLTPTKSYPSLYWVSPGPGQHPLWSNDWKHDTKAGGMLFINQKKIDDQKNVIKFVLSKIGKNIMSGKSVLNISLPVDIFTAKSNLQLLIQSLCYATLLLQKVADKDQMQKFKSVAAFGVSMSSLYLIMEKPFNPILGQTFQAWINGCPAYGEQISHHPPISALMVYGRGYTISGQLQSKAELHMNSGKGTNEGIFRVNFNDGTKICYCSAGGEVTGVTYGDRKFNVQGKAYCWSQAQHYFAQIIYNPTKKGFFSMKKQQQPQDYFQGQAYKVSASFIMSLEKSRRPPNQNQIVSTLGKFSGIWHQKITYQNEEVLNIIEQLPHKLQYQKNPLPSDSNWREDIAYRRLMQIPKAQSEKQRLEIIQRNDRKLRQKKGKK